MKKELIMNHFIVLQLICKIPNEKKFMLMFLITQTHAHTTSIGWEHITMNKNVVTNIIFLDVAFWTSTKRVVEEWFFIAHLF